MPLGPTTTFIPSTDVDWDFGGQVVLITGAAHGQGAVHAETFAEKGADVVVSDLAGEVDYVTYPLGTAAELEATAEKVRDLGRRCISAVCDVRRPNEVKGLVERTIEEFGHLDIVISNAGIGGRKPVVDMPAAQWVATIDTNLSAAFYLCKYAGPHMIEAGYGRILATGSTQSVGGTNEVSAYTSAKHGLVGLVEGFAREFADHGVTINLVCPTAVDTPMNKSFVDPTTADWIAEATRLVGSWNLLLAEGMMHEREVSEAMMWLASRAAGHISGATLMLDGGCTAK
jgi:NAD(P)-dependent dehydrogenase (short-subunit alcohol dehydrogenase family)